MSKNIGLLHGFYAMGLAIGLSFGVSAAVSQSDWCTVEAPDSVSSGQRFNVRVTLKKDLPAGHSLSCHMRCSKRSAPGGGMYAFVPPKDVTHAGQSATFSFLAKPGSDVQDFLPVVFSAPGSDWNKKSHSANAKKIAFAEDPAVLVHAEAVKRPASVTFKKSWIVILNPAFSSVRAGEKFTLEVEYRLDPSDDWGDGTKLQLMPLGPWIDNPDGVYNKVRQHVGIRGLGTQVRPVKPGTGKLAFDFTVPEGSTFERSGVFFRAKFIGGDGKEWPCEIRGAGLDILPETFGLRLTTPAAGGLYFYGEKPAIRVVWGNVAAAGSSVTLPFTVTAPDGTVVTSFSKTLTVGTPGSTTDIELPAISRRGAFAVTTVFTDGKGQAQSRGAFFATIPDVVRVLGGKRAPFGCTDLSTAEECAAAAKIGFKYCRLFTPWTGLEPACGRWALESLDARVDRIRAVGIAPWIAITGAPEWETPVGVHSPGFCPFPFDDAGWQDAATHLAQHYRGRIFGFEWLNEIVPGDKSLAPVDDYLRFCAVGTKAVKAVDPSYKIQLAGGLWPRNFRLDLIRAGVLSSVDILPVHYSSYDGVLEARADAAAGGHPEVWDNESAHGISVWNMPPVAALTNSVMQSLWVMRQWPGELVAGARTLVYFGGGAQAPGNWTYLLDGHSPRPVAATLAVLASKFGDARPVGAVYLDPGAIVYLFERTDGRGLASVMSASESESESCAVKIPVGTGTATGRQPPATSPLFLTDHQGNESALSAVAGYASLPVAPMPVILEGFDPSPLAAASSISIAGQGALVPRPTVRAVAGTVAKVAISLTNPLRTPVAGAVSVEFGAKRLPAQAVNLAPGASAYFTFDAGDAAALPKEGRVLVAWKEPRTLAIRTFSLEVIDPALLGNLLQNSGFEQAGNKPEVSALWGGGLRRIALPGGAPGLGGFAVESSHSKGYEHVGQKVSFSTRGLTYLYSAWMWTENGGIGSNVSLDHDSGKSETLTMPHVFSAPKSTKGWTFMTKRLATASDVKAATFIPVATTADGRARCDNVRVTVFDGTDYATEAFRARKGIKADADLSDWDLSNPVPLLCENQVTGTGGYNWSPVNLSGEAWFAWDKDALYFAARVRDDVHVAKTGDDTPDGDAITLALHPANRVPGTDGQALEWYISSANPGGGSGACTLYRPAAHCAGLKSGQLAKDSSTYEIAVKTVGDITTYELRIPWPEVGGFVPELGAKLGLSLRLTDADNGAARGAAAWGMGLAPAWAPTAFGVLTLVE